MGIDIIKNWRISIHALREEGDVDKFIASYGTIISIHALREEGDETSLSSTKILRNFYPRPPRGGRRSTNPVRLKGDMISIHALREEGD